ncbi:hypothetical protein NQ318_020105, partial [Aromia moschata]
FSIHSRGDYSLFRNRFYSAKYGQDDVSSPVNTLPEMRALVVSIWVFINLVFFGMCGYMYLLWSQYWMYMDRQTETTTSTYDQQIYYYNRGYYPNDINNRSESRPRTKHSTSKENSSFTLVKNSKPRFPNLQPKEFELDTKRYICRRNDSSVDCYSKTSEYKDKIIKELRKVFTDESNILKTGSENPYNVRYGGKRGNYLDKTPKDILCELRETPMNMLKRRDVGSHPVREYIPRRGLFENKRFNSCAIVASAGALRHSNLGSLIDSHDLVLRFNHAPTKGFSRDVGKKTTVRVLNSQVVTKNEFKFLKSDLYKNITLIAWDPSNYSTTIADWLDRPEFDLFPNYIEHRKRDPKSRFYLVEPRSIWELWDFLQGQLAEPAEAKSTVFRLPGSVCYSLVMVCLKWCLRHEKPRLILKGLPRLRILLPHCDFVDIFEYVPSTRVTKRCHYYDPEDNPACTFGVWHPLAAEKLLTYHINSAEDEAVFQTGFVRIEGFRNLNCR